ncbi:hypothetical protein Agabi119p4_9255 [Agaricus bisporus var. burnettii]|uniref:Uncharacterized protein n=1 Tax=Agaricus bisporus var. burnettii TaxID=192524 RepID=A0A8H7C505_AGABI|nr:hypothetical protein Agabi119p4_9255 [Agaricus bisporus var. burnettii]
MSFLLRSIGRPNPGRQCLRHYTATGYFDVLQPIAYVIKICEHPHSIPVTRRIQYHVVLHQIVTHAFQLAYLLA